MAMSASQLRQDIYRLLDQVLETGDALEVDRKGRRLRIVPDEPVSKLNRLQPHPDAIVGDPEDLVTTDWSDTWDADRTVDP